MGQAKLRTVKLEKVAAETVNRARGRYEKFKETNHSIPDFHAFLGISKDILMISNKPVTPKVARKLNLLNSKYWMVLLKIRLIKISK